MYASPSSSPHRRDEEIEDGRRVKVTSSSEQDPVPTTRKQGEESTTALTTTCTSKQHLLLGLFLFGISILYCLFGEVQESSREVLLEKTTVAVGNTTASDGIISSSISSKEKSFSSCNFESANGHYETNVSDGG